MTQDIKKDLLTTTLAFRVDSKTKEKFQTLTTKSGMRQSDFFRFLLTTQLNELKIDELDLEKKIVLKQLLYLTNKSSNNINQLTKKINSAYLNGTLQERTYELLLNELISISEYFNNTLTLVENL